MNIETLERYLGRHQQAQELPVNPFNNAILHWLYKWCWEFPLHHFFVLSGASRIFAIASFILFGGTFYAVGTTSLAGCAFFFGSIAISLVLAMISHYLNDKEDTIILSNQQTVLNFISKMPSSKNNQESGENTPKDNKQSKNTIEWRRLNYGEITQNTSYLKVVYMMDAIIVIAAVANIIDEILRWKAIVPISSLLLSAGTAGVIITVLCIALVCLYYKNKYTREIISARENNARLIKAAKELGDKDLKEKINQLETQKTPRNTTWLDYLLDEYGVFLWNAAVTIFPVIYMINLIATTCFFLPSILVSWPLFILELIPSIMLASTFAYMKHEDNQHDIKFIQLTAYISENKTANFNQIAPENKQQDEDKEPFKNPTFWGPWPGKEPDDDGKKVTKDEITCKIRYINF